MIKLGGSGFYPLAAVSTTADPSLSPFLTGSSSSPLGPGGVSSGPSTSRGPPAAASSFVFGPGDGESQGRFPSVFGGQPPPQAQPPQAQPAPRSPMPAVAAPPASPWNSSLQPPPVFGRRKAVLIGCNYEGTSNELRGCRTDSRCLHYLLTTRFQFQQRDILVLTVTNAALGL